MKIKPLFLFSILVLTFSCGTVAEPNRVIKSSSFENENKYQLVSEFHQFLTSEIDLRWQKKFVAVTYDEPFSLLNEFTELIKKRKRLLQLKVSLVEKTQTFIYRIFKENLNWSHK